jgi:hypothetical protein
MIKQTTKDKSLNSFTGSNTDSGLRAAVTIGSNLEIAYPEKKVAAYVAYVANAVRSVSLTGVIISPNPMPSAIANIMISTFIGR